ncbi:MULTISPECIES: HAMP domain-containing sensor histidine kinase [unclassified Streptomyces]|uniref:sensor histidine kinase n=1 Tax=unclassified Streptomyces TaxID=2593676 RepID=UPI002E151E78|nr:MULTISPECIES: HAMP domain-containing sensor histidine kinase [unclassified Streptomyces]WSQ82092.1 HAMP domain-containing histidine kinase [Streptomyces sp. NBC_01213]WSQ89419.1 HAMP domain-containing histidine kinase [Streptomyces sp. NBC_01212]WSR11072.1 HAMP domain-containing histidine kinase [Streptomyces sp. NBC_01208]
MNTAEPRRRWWPRSVRARTALAVASTAAVILVAIGWWLHRDVYRQSTQIALGQAQAPLLALADQLREGKIPSRRSAVPFEVVATGRSTAVASGGGMDVFAPGSPHVLPAPPRLSEPLVTDSGWYYEQRTIRIPERRDEPAGRFDLGGGTYAVLSTDIWAGELSSTGAANLGVSPDTTLRVHVVVLPHTTNAITDSVNSLLVRAGLVSLVLISAITYFTVRIALRPVEAIRVATASVTASDPRERVSVPATGHEITALATTINTTLQRLDDAAAQQRRFIADAAHELRSPLTTLLASLEVALAYPDRTDWPTAVTTAARQTRRLQALAEDLLLLARLDAHAPTTGSGTVDLAALVSLLVEQYGLPDRPVALTADTAAPAYVRGSKGDYERLLRNLVDNAARHATSRVQVNVRNQDEQVVLSVHDDGPGVPGEDAERVFERFVRLDDARSRDRGGTGLGLPIARELAHRHRGTLALVPSDLGACFRLRLPRAPAPPEP